MTAGSAASVSVSSHAICRTVSAAALLLLPSGFQCVLGRNFLMDLGIATSSNSFGRQRISSRYR